MDFYIYQAAHYCVECAESICRELSDSGLAPLCVCGADYSAHKVDMDNAATLGMLVATDSPNVCHGYEPNENTYDSDDYPKGPFVESMGESDSPSYCYDCDKFLENPLTSEGMEYIINEILRYVLNGKGNKEVLTEWIDFYNITINDLTEGLTIHDLMDR